MFFAVDIVDNIPLECDSAGNTFTETFQKLRQKLQSKYVDKVVSNQGLCVYILDIRRIDPMPVLSPNDGRPCYKVQFTSILFKPQHKEVIYGHITASDATGLKISTRFFQDIRIPARLLPQPTFFDEDSQLWRWRVEAEDEFGVKKQSDLYMELESQVRLKVEDIVYGKEEEAAKQEATKQTENSATPMTVPMLIIGSMVNQGLGLVDWW
eukprot:Protomagalhaensia_sp_Gyna_25__3533@NODE_3176_length_696_cov_3_634703_g2658_i0_p1_GENE_NODE_3176_length_696_cov_3_634703_g2658_i0NODE_3176_length_696_cov_3_634703_g2658_i0_p1_ORF_typecomplete_len210_score39_92RNA_pol_Rbc25/PF08292_12/3_5e31SHS2_Rpb7N/PF03876_17/2_1e07_NODE_3176_length_696_cov_3_634703_g2658_i033662